MKHYEASFVQPDARFWASKKRKIVTKSMSYKRYGEILFQKVALGYEWPVVQNGSSNNVLKLSCLHKSVETLTFSKICISEWGVSPHGIFQPCACVGSGLWPAQKIQCRRRATAEKSCVWPTRNDTCWGEVASGLHEMILFGGSVRLA